MNFCESFVRKFTFSWHNNWHIGLFVGPRSTLGLMRAWQTLCWALVSLTHLIYLEVMLYLQVVSQEETTRENGTDVNTPAHSLTRFLL